jgi:hypothetical protein
MILIFELVVLSYESVLLKIPRLLTDIDNNILQFWCYQFKDLRLSSSIDNNINNFNKINDLV